jgi:hypothetical protein
MEPRIWRLHEGGHGMGQGKVGCRYMVEANCSWALPVDQHHALPKLLGASLPALAGSRGPSRLAAAWAPPRQSIRCMPVSAALRDQGGPALCLGP